MSNLVTTLLSVFAMTSSSGCVGGLGIPHLRDNGTRMGRLEMRVFGEEGAESIADFEMELVLRTANIRDLLQR
jgi:hypothetical protein